MNANNSQVYETICRLLEKESIDTVGCIPFSEATILHAHLVPEGVKSVVLFLIPYDSGERFSDGVSVYAHIPDYHAYFSALKDRLFKSLSELCPEFHFYGFADHSPIVEKIACAKAGLGVIGKNSLLINERYGSYVFIGSILTDAELPCHTIEIRGCINCETCIKNCPGHAIQPDGFSTENCLSMISQKKILTQSNKLLLAENKVAWGCDRCQEVCPMNADRIFSAIPFFKEHVHGNFSSEEIAQMDDETFRSYAFSWRGRSRITENLQNLEKHG